ncbi:hypothetical protein J9303_11385 [Bacillaceae bacterium Marseille-Q3522]|nr:hypothetical protein [Bacillaceae bacterium Marseille-Q3522]
MHQNINAMISGVSSAPRLNIPGMGVITHKGKNIPCSSIIIFIYLSFLFTGSTVSPIRKVDAKKTPLSKVNKDV